MILELDCFMMLELDCLPFFIWVAGSITAFRSKFKAFFIDSYTKQVKTCKVYLAHLLLVFSSCLVSFNYCSLLVGGSLSISLNYFQTKLCL